MLFVLFFWTRLVFLFGTRGRQYHGINDSLFIRHIRTYNRACARWTGYKFPEMDALGRVYSVLQWSSLSTQILGECTHDRISPPSNWALLSTILILYPNLGCLSTLFFPYLTVKKTLRNTPLQNTIDRPVTQGSASGPDRSQLPRNLDGWMGTGWIHPYCTITYYTGNQKQVRTTYIFVSFNGEYWQPYVVSGRKLVKPEIPLTR